MTNFITINGNVNITVNGSVNYYSAIKPISDAKDELLKILYNKRNNEGWGGYKGWNYMLDLYYCGAYRKLYNHVKQFKNCVGAKDKVLECLNIIMQNEVIK